MWASSAVPPHEGCRRRHVVLFTTGGSLSAGAAEVSRLQFISLRLANFGSYEDEVKYPLGGRGLVLIKGVQQSTLQGALARIFQDSFE